jgi:membrane protein DedA with SNARE-associated domain
MKAIDAHNGVLRTIRTQLFLLCFISGLAVASNYGILPPSSELLGYVRGLFTKYGLPAIAVCSLIENIVGLNLYFPGSVVILSGMALTSGHPAFALKTWVVIFCFAEIAHYMNFFFGRVTSGKDSRSSDHQPEDKLGMKQRGMLVLFIGSYWHPHSAAVTSLECGVNGVKLCTFSTYLALALGLWYGFWGVLMYNIGRSIPERVNLLPLFIGYIVVWIFWDVIRFIRRRSEPGIHQ